MGCVCGASLVQKPGINLTQEGLAPVSTLHVKITSEVLLYRGFFPWREVLCLLFTNWPTHLTS